jgi:hypothetical protein
MLGLKEVKLSTISWGTGTQSNEGVTMSKFRKTYNKQNNKNTWPIDT